ncbi:MAG: cytochrome c biogenesis protein ResB, partial [Stackebrandtia sp.]
MTTRPLSRRFVATARRWWRQLTSMRTALILLLILAIAAVPGSLLPQRNISADDVSGYYAENPSLAPVLDRLWAFDVYASPWFSAIYLLLFTSLVGCLIPRLREHIRALRRRPPDAPARLSLLPQHRRLPDDTDPAKVAKALRRERFRVAVREHDDGSVTVSAQKGYLRDAGNLLFHFSMIGLLLGLAFGSLFGWNGNRLLVAGEEGAFCNSLQQYDEYGMGPSIDADSLPPFCVQMDSFTAEYLDNGQPVQYTAHIRYGENGDAPNTPHTLEVNHPLEVDGASVFLLGQGYAPIISYT